VGGFVLAIPIPEIAVTKQRTAVGLDGMAIRIEPLFAGADGDTGMIISGWMGHKSFLQSSHMAG
jgi:hypothetical protein